MSHSSKPTPEKENNYLKFYSLALELVVSNVALIWGGYLLDEHINSSPAFILTGTVLAMAGTVWILLKRLN